MTAVIDTSSLLSLVRYYLPFDKTETLLMFVKSKIQTGEWIIIDEVLRECKYISKGIVLNKISCLLDKEFMKIAKCPTSTESLLPPSPAKFYNQVDNSFINGSARNKLDNLEYESLRASFLSSADARMIIYCLNELKNNIFGDVVLVTEETDESNDNKAFRKIPAICKILDIEVLTLPQLMERYSDIDLSIV
jgi:hypothetical protein